MSEEQTTQTAVDTTKTPAEPGVAADGARTDGDEIEKLIAEFDNSTKPAPEPAKPEQTGAAPDVDRIVDEKVERKLAERENRADAAKFADEIVKEFGVTPRIAKGWLDQYAREVPAALDAFVNRPSDPGRWAKWQKAMLKEFGKEHRQTKIDANATEDRESVTAAVRGTSTKVPEGKAPDFSRMSPQEFAEAKDRMFGG